MQLNKEARADLAAWSFFLDNFNCRAFVPKDIWTSSNSLNLYTDAAGSLGYGAVFGRKWLYGEWPENWKRLGISFLELFPIVVAVKTWGNLLANNNVYFFTDNEALVYIINKQTSSDKLIMSLLRSLVITCLQCNIMFKAKHIPGVINTAADLLSRLQVKQFQTIFPQVEKSPRTLPQDFNPTTFKLP